MGLSDLSQGRTLSPVSSEVLWTLKTQFGSPDQGHSCPGRQRMWGGSTGLRHRCVPAILRQGVWPATQQSRSLSSSCPQRGQSTLDQVDQGLQVGRALIRILGVGGDSRLSLSQGMGQGHCRTQRNMGILEDRGRRHNHHTPDCPLTPIYTSALGLVTHISITQRPGAWRLRPLLAQAGVPTLLTGGSRANTQPGSGRMAVDNGCWAVLAEGSGKR